MGPFPLGRNGAQGAAPRNKCVEFGGASRLGSRLFNLFSRSLGFFSKVRGPRALNGCVRVTGIRDDCRRGKLGFLGLVEES